MESADLSKPNNNSRVVLTYKESPIVRGVGVGLVGFCLLVAVVFLALGIMGRDVFRIIVASLFIGWFGPWFFITLTEYFRRVALSDNHISIEGWRGVPLVYAYDQIADIETVTLKEDDLSWRGNHIKLTFNDGKVVRVQAGLASAREFRRLLREKAGRTFRKKRKRKS